MEISTYLRLLWKYGWLILLTTGITVLVVFVGTRNPVFYYEAYSLVRIEAIQTGDGNWKDFNLFYTDRIMNTYTTLALSADVYKELQVQLDIEDLPEITFDPLPNTELIQITARSEDPAVAADAATAVAYAMADRRWEQNNNADTVMLEAAEAFRQGLVDERSAKEALEARDMASLTAFNQIIFDIEKLTEAIDLLDQRLLNWQITDTLLQDRISVVEEAPVPDEPAGPNNSMVKILSAFVGIIGGIGLALVLEQFDHRILRVPQLTALTDLPVIGTLPRFKKPGNHKHIQLKTRLFQRLQAKLSNISIVADANLEDENSDWQVLMVTSAEVQAGKSFIVTELAHSFARSQYKTLVLNLTPSIMALERDASAATQDTSPGLLAGNIEIENFIQKESGSGVYVLAHEYPITALSLSRSNLLNTLREKFDIILVDTPAMLASEAAIMMIPVVDAVLPVVHLKRTRTHNFQMMEEELQSANLIGVVVNAAPEDSIIRFTRRYNPAKGLSG
ncbi:MAG: hypothetical protein ACPG7F_05240 [Aggregatilineales bacterium]